MAKIYNSDVTKGLANNAGIQINTDKVPNELAEKIVPTFETNPQLLRRTTKHAGLRGVSGGTTIFTTSAINETYITGFNISIETTALHGSDSVYLRFYIGGAICYLTEIELTPGTAQSKEMAMSFPFPIKVDKNSIISVAPVVALNLAISVNIFYFENESSA